MPANAESTGALGLRARAAELAGRSVHASRSCATAIPFAGNWLNSESDPGKAAGAADSNCLLKEGLFQQFVNREPQPLSFRSFLRLSIAALSISVLSIFVARSALAMDMRFDVATDNNSGDDTDWFGPQQLPALNFYSVNGHNIEQGNASNQSTIQSGGNTMGVYYDTFDNLYSSTETPAAAAATVQSWIKSQYGGNTETNSWIVLNEVNTSVWDSSSGSLYRTWLVSTMQALNGLGYKNIILYAQPVLATKSFASTWQGIAQYAYIGNEGFIDGQVVVADNFSVSTLQAQYQAWYNDWTSTTSGAGVAAAKVLEGEHFSVNEFASPTYWGADGISGTQWQEAIEARDIAIHNVPFGGFIGYAWDKDAQATGNPTVDLANQIAYEKAYASTMVVQTEVPTWTGNDGSDSWNDYLNWTGGLPSTTSAPYPLLASTNPNLSKQTTANFEGAIKTNTAITLDGNQSITNLGFNSPFSYTIAPGTGGTLTITGSGATVSVLQGFDYVAAGTIIGSNVTANLTGTLTLYGGVTNNGFTVSKSGAGNLVFAGTISDAANSAVSVSAGRFYADSDLGTSASSTLALSVSGGSAILNTSQHLRSISATGGLVEAVGYSTTRIGQSLSVSSSGQFLADTDGLSLDNSASAGLSISGAADRITLDFNDMGGATSGPFWGLRWAGNHVAALEADLNQNGFTGNGLINTSASAQYFDPTTLTVSTATFGGALYTYVGFPTTRPMYWTGVNSDGVTANSSWDTTETANNLAAGGAAFYYINGRSVIFSDLNPLTNTKVANPSVVVQFNGVSPSSVLFTNTGAASGGVDYTISNQYATAVGITGSAGITLQGSGNVTLQSPNTFTGPVAINAGQLIIQDGGALGTSSGVSVASGGALQINGGIGVSPGIPLSISGTGLAGNPAGALNSTGGSNFYPGLVTLAGNATINSSGSGNTLTFSGGINAGNNALTLSGTGNIAISSPLTLGSAAVFSIAANTATISGAFSMGPSSTVAVTSGTLVFNASTGSNISGSNGGVSIAAGATVQLTGSKSALTDATTPAQTASVANDGSLQIVGATNQTVGAITSLSPPTSENGATVYSGSTTVGDGSNAATLIATQILQNSLIIGAGSTVAIVPSGAVGNQTTAGAASSSTSAVSGSSVSNESAAGASSSLAAIQAAIDSGELSSTMGQILENRIASIATIASEDPDIASLLENRVMAELATLTTPPPAPPTYDETMAEFTSDKRWFKPVRRSRRRRRRKYCERVKCGSGAAGISSGRPHWLRSFRSAFGSAQVRLEKLSRDAVQWAEASFIASRISNRAFGALARITRAGRICSSLVARPFHRN